MYTTHPLISSWFPFSKPSHVVSPWFFPNVQTNPVETWPKTSWSVARPDTCWKHVWGIWFQYIHKFPLYLSAEDILDFFLATNGETGPRKSSKILVWTPNSYKLTGCEVNFQRFSSLIANHGRLCWQATSLRLFWWLPRMLVPLRALACCKSQWYFLKGDSPCCGGFLFYQTSWELTYPIKRQLGREVSFPIGGRVSDSLPNAIILQKLVDMTKAPLTSHGLMVAWILYELLKKSASKQSVRSAKASLQKQPFISTQSLKHQNMLNKSNMRIYVYTTAKVLVKKSMKIIHIHTFQTYTYVCLRCLHRHLQSRSCG